MKLYAAAAPYVIVEHDVWARKAVKYDGGGTKSCGVEKRREHLIGLSKQSTINGLTFEEIGLSQDCKEDAWRDPDAPHNPRARETTAAVLMLMLSPQMRCQYTLAHESKDSRT